MMIERNFDKGPIQDLADFYSRWPNLRDRAEQVIESSSLNADQREVVLWLKHLADRVGPQDIADDEDSSVL